MDSSENEYFETGRMRYGLVDEACGMLMENVRILEYDTAA